MSDTARFVTLLIPDLREKNRLHTTLLSFSRPVKAAWSMLENDILSLEMGKGKTLRPSPPSLHTFLLSSLGGTSKEKEETAGKTTHEIC